MKQTMKANVTYEDGTPNHFTVSGDRTRWFWNMNDGVATFQRVEVDKDDHSTETTVVLFGNEWYQCKELVEGLPFVDEMQINEPIESP